MISRENFEKYLQTLISEKEKESINKSILTKSIISIVSLFLAMIFVFLVVISTTVNVFFIICAVFFALISLIVILSRKSGAYSKLESKYKEQVIDYLLSDVTHKFERDAYVSRGVFYDSQLVQSFDKYSGEDRLTIAVNEETDTYLTISDVCATEEVWDENEEKYKTVTRYKGVLGYIRFPHQFKCRLTLNRKEYAWGTGLDTVSLESIDFNKKFLVKSDDQLEARYILTPDVMQKLLDLHAVEDNFECVMDGDMMYISIPGKNLFTLGAKQKQVDGMVFMRFYEDISLIMSIIKEINNNDKIFKI